MSKEEYKTAILRFLEKADEEEMRKIYFLLIGLLMG